MDLVEAMLGVERILGGVAILLDAFFERTLDLPYVVLRMRPLYSHYVGLRALLVGRATVCSLSQYLLYQLDYRLSTLFYRVWVRLAIAWHFSGAALLLPQPLPLLPCLGSARHCLALLWSCPSAPSAASSPPAPSRASPRSIAVGGAARR